MSDKRNIFKNVRVILPDNGRGDAVPEGDERCRVCGEERLTIRVVYAEQAELKN